MCLDNEGAGIYIRLSSNKNTFINNTCIGNKTGFGIDHSSHNVISYNTISLNSDGGVSVDGGLVSQPEGTYEWNEFKEMSGPWEKHKELIQAIEPKIEGENCAGNMINWNNIEGNANWGFSTHNISSSVEIDATNNWWGDPSGPSGAGPGTGDVVSDQVVYSPWLDAPYREGNTTR